ETSGASVLLLHDCIHLDTRLRSLPGDNWGLDTPAAPRLSMEPALKARSIPAQGNTLGKPALLGSCALQGRRPPSSPRRPLLRQAPTPEIGTMTQWFASPTVTAI